MSKVALIALTLAAASWATHASVAQEADAASGERLFQQRCGACHQIATTRNGAGPHLQGVVGRAAGSVEGFNYSPALRDSGITWTADTLESYLTNPTAMVRGTRMVQRFNNADERVAIIAFLSNRQRGARLTSRRPAGEPDGAARLRLVRPTTADGARRSVCHRRRARRYHIASVRRVGAMIGKDVRQDLRSARSPSGLAAEITAGPPHGDSLLSARFLNE